MGSFRFRSPTCGEIEMKKTHYRDEQPDDMNVERAGCCWALCGKLTTEETASLVEDDVSCGSCNHILVNRQTAQHAA